MRRISGFTLLELSIVLVVIGLLVGAILFGRDLVMQARIRKLIGEAESYKTAVNAFKFKYNCLPGDCRKAYDFFDASCSASAATCNGNGDGKVDIMDPPPIPRMGQPQETYMLPRHLFLAGLASQSVTGADAGGPSAQVGVNIPMSAAFPQTGYAIIYSDQYASASGNTMIVGKNNNSTDTTSSGQGYPPHAPFLTTLEAASIDRKYDDGSPYSGFIGGGDGAGGFAVYPCVDSTIPTQPKYNLVNTSIVCDLQFFRMF